MFYVPFWIMIAAFIAMGLVTISIHKMTFIDSLVIIMVIALTLACDMLTSQFSMYFIVSEQYATWYSFWSALIIYPSMAITFLKFAPKSKYAVMVYVLLWVFGLTLFEISIVPYIISVYVSWAIIPWSPIVYLMAFTLIYFYNQFLTKRISNDPNYCEMLQVYLNNQKDFNSLDLPSNGIQAVDLIPTQIPNLIIIDAVMPKLEGLVVLERISPSLTIVSTCSRGDEHSEFIPLQDDEYKKMSKVS